ncbi:MAG TPA: NAD(P)-dependent alcohol dehydrogenase [Bacteroidales bacterium]|nr:NAD(P)-dependent alcohol dehydrogenase [Bacteroidales bacterium]
MKAVVYNREAKPYRLVLREVEKPFPKDDEVLVSIRAASVNAADYRSMKMGMIPARKIFGADISGVVESAGKNVKLFRPGDEVVGDLSGCGFGGFADFALATEKALVHKPAGLSFEMAAALPMASMTALQALRNKGQIQKGQEVCILGSSGGVGTIAIQLARHFGAVITAVCSTQNVEQSQLLGADRVIDYSKEDFAVGNRKYDLIIAVNGNYSLLKCRKALKADGRYVLVGGALSQIFKAIVIGKPLSLGRKKMLFLAAKTDTNDLRYLLGLASDGIIKPVIEKYFSPETTAEAMKYAAGGHARGKVVIKWNPEA